MELSQYLEMTNLDGKAFARQIGVHPNTVYALCKYKNEPLVTLAFRVEEGTRGKVTAKELAGEWARRKNGR